MHFDLEIPVFALISFIVQDHVLVLHLLVFTWHLCSELWLCKEGNSVTDDIDIDQQRTTVTCSNIVNANTSNSTIYKYKRIFIYTSTSSIDFCCKWLSKGQEVVLEDFEGC